MNQVQDFIKYLFDAVRFWIIVMPWESAIRVRLGKKVNKLGAGMHFRLPYFDSIYKQENRLRICAMPIQTLTTKDNKSVTLNGALGYKITDIEKLYNTLYQPESTIVNMGMSKLADFVHKTNSEDLEPIKIEKDLMNKMGQEDFGLKFEYIKITNFAIVQTFRLIKDNTWHWEGLDLSEKS